MKPVTTLAIAALLSLGLGTAISPAFAKSIGTCQDDVAISGTNAIDSDAPAILASLKQKGVNAQDVSDWGGCVRADVIRKDGSTAMEYFDPDTLQRLNPNG
jgi:hypothetical protein